MLLRFIKKYAEILSLGGFLAYWLWEAKLSAFWTSDFASKQLSNWLSITNTLATLILSLVALYGINSWRNEYKNKRRFEIAIDFAEQASNTIASVEHITDPRISYTQVPDHPVLTAQNLKESRITRLKEELDSINKFGSRRYRYKMLLGNCTEDICSELIRLANGVQLACDEYVELTSRLLASNEEESPAAVAHIKEQLQDANNRMCCTRNSPIYLSLKRLNRDVERILKENTF